MTDINVYLPCNSFLLNPYTTSISTNKTKRSKMIMASLLWIFIVPVLLYVSIQYYEIDSVCCNINMICMLHSGSAGLDKLTGNSSTDRKGKNYESRDFELIQNIN